MSNLEVVNASKEDGVHSRGRHLNQEAKMGWRIFSRAEKEELRDPIKKVTVIGSLVTSLSTMTMPPVLASESIADSSDPISTETNSALIETEIYPEVNSLDSQGTSEDYSAIESSQANTISLTVNSGEHPYELAIKLGFESVKEMADFNNLDIDWEYKSDKYEGPYLHLVPGQVLSGERQAEVSPEIEEPIINNQPESVDEPQDNSSVTESLPETEILPEEQTKPEPQPRPQLSPEHTAVLNHYDAMNKFCGPIIPTGKQKLKQSKEEVEKLAGEYSEAIQTNNVGKFFNELRDKQFKYIASQLETDYEGAIAHCISGIARETGIVWDDLNDERQKQWLVTKDQYIKEVAQGQSLHEVESRIEEAKLLSIGAHDKLARAIPELNQGLSEELSASRAIRLLAGESLRQLVIDEVEWVVDNRDDGTTLNGLMGRVLVYDLRNLDEPIQVDISQDHLQAIGRRYITGDFTIETFNESMDKSRSEIKALYELLLLDTPSSTRIDELSLDLLSGRTLRDIRKGLVNHKANNKSSSAKEIYEEIIRAHIANEEILNNDKLIDGLSTNLEASDSQKVDITIDSIIQAVDRGDITELEQMAAPIVEIASFLDLSGLQIKDMLLEKYGNGNSGKLNEEELQKIGEVWGNHKLNPAAAAAFRLLSEAFASEFSKPISMSDSYRSYEQQVKTKGEKGRLAATPGTSNHGWGLAVDLASNINDFGTKEHKWMRANAAKFGWVLPEWANDGKGIEEPWHWEYVGKPEVTSSEIEEPEKDESPRDNRFELPENVKESVDIFGPTGSVLFDDDGNLLIKSQENIRRAADDAPSWEKAAKADWREQRDSSVTIPLYDVALLYGAAGFAAEEESVWVEQVAATIAISNAIKMEDTYWFTMQLALDDGDRPRACFSGIYLENVSNPKAKISPFDCVKLAYENYQANGRGSIPELVNGKAEPFLDEAQEAVDRIKFHMAYNPAGNGKQAFEDKVTAAIEGKIHIAEEEVLERSVIELHTTHGFSEKGAAWFTANLDWESGFKPHVCGDHGKSCGLAQWQQPRRDQIAQHFGEFPQDIWGQFEAAVWEMKTHYPEAYRIYSDPSSSDEDLKRAAKIYEGYGQAGQRHELGQQLAETISGDR